MKILKNKKILLLVIFVAVAASIISFQNFSSATAATFTPTVLFSGSVAGTCSGSPGDVNGPSCPATEVDVKGDSVTAPDNAIVSGMTIDHNFGGSAATGGFTGLEVTLNQTATTGNKNNGNYVGVLSVVQGNRTIEVKQGNVTETLDTGDHALKVSQGNRTVEVSQGNVTETLDQGNYSAKLSVGNHSTELSQGNHSVKLDVGASSVDAMQSITLKVGSNSLTIDQTGVTVKGMMISIQGQVQVEVKGVMTTVSGDGMLTLKGGMTMIN